MIDDIVEFILYCIIFTLFYYTGEIVLYLITFGRKKIRWDYYTKERGSIFVLFSTISEWIGIAFWIFIGVILIN